jgi:MFS-type transporter involved in bile tolerance (Atg22 family)
MSGSIAKTNTCNHLIILKKIQILTGHVHMGRDTLFNKKKRDMNKSRVTVPIIGLIIPCLNFPHCTCRL